VTEQVQVLTCRIIYKQSLVTYQLAEGVHNSIDDTSEDEVIPTPPAP
jgi:hypothetical protein